MAFHRLTRHVFRLPLGSLALLLNACSQGSPGERESLGSIEEEIINGDAPAKGGLESWGVVALSSGCSGVLLTNRHVLTAQHCIRDIETAPHGSYLPITVTLERANGDVPIKASSALEHDPPHSLESRDYAVLVLDEPMTILDASDRYFRGVFAGADSSLKTKSVFCAGYGMTTLASNTSGRWVPAGNGMLTSANQTIDDVWGGGKDGTLIRRLHHGIVGAGGDSGSPCFYRDGSTWVVTGPQSNCPDFSWQDLNGDKEFDWSEATAIRECRGAAPSAYRWLIEQNLFSEVNVVFDALPALPTGTTAPGMVAANDAVHDTDLLQSSTFEVPKSGRVDIEVESEPARMLCPRLSVVAPMSGAFSVKGRCLGDGLVSSMML